MVGKICTVCKQCSAANKKLSFFTYPGDRERRYEWLKAVDRLDLFEKLVDHKSRGNHRICEAHFLDSFIKTSKGVTKGRKCLTKDAIPSLKHVNQALLNAEESFDAVTLSKKKNSKYSRNKHMKIDITDSFVNMDMEPEIAVPSSKIILDSDNTILKMGVPIDEIKTEKIDEDFHPSPHFTSPDLTGFPDMSQFCESVIKVNKETQTPQAEDHTKQIKKRKLDPAESTDNFIQTCSRNLPKGMVQLVKWQLNSKENVDSYKFYMFALNLYFSGANSYNMLKDMMGLPDVNTIKKLFTPETTKFDNRLINALKIKVDNMSTRERICSLSIGSMSLEPSLYYNIIKDKVEGFHEIDGVQKLERAKYALVFMVRGILEKWTQPIAHAFIAHHENSPDISIWVEEIITLLIDVGLDVRTFVSDPQTELLYMLKSQRVTPEKPYFTINDKNIYYIYDTVKLQKTVESHIKNCNFYIKDPTSDTNDNILFIRKFSNLCNILNSTTHVTMSPFKRAYSNRKYQNNFFKNMLTLLQKLKVIRHSDGKDITKNMKFIDSIQISIISIMQLYEDLKSSGAKMLLTSRISQKSLNKFFAKTRSRGKKGCSSRQFKTSFCRCFVYNMLKIPIGDRRYPAHGFSPQSLLSVGKSTSHTIKVGTTDYRLALPEKKRFDTVCRYLYLKCIDYHSCNTFKEYLSRSPGSRQYAAPYRSPAPLDIRNCKLLPPGHFIDFIAILEKRFRDYCRQDVKITSIGHQVLKKISSFKFKMPCQCFPLDYLKKLFVRLRIFYAVRENNIMYKKYQNQLFKAFNL